MNVRRSDPASSQEAAGLRREFPWKVLLAACKLADFTDDLLQELAEAGDRNVIARRRLDLETGGYVERITDPTGKPVRAVNPSGVKVLTFRVTQAGVDKMLAELKERKKHGR